MEIFFEPKPEIKPKERMSVFIEVDLKKRLKKISEIECVSLNQVCRVFLSLMVEEYQSNIKETRLEDFPWLYE
jgi:hypothetical protein